MSLVRPLKEPYKAFRAPLVPIVLGGLSHCWRMAPSMSNKIVLEEANATPNVNVWTDEAAAKQMRGLERANAHSSTP